MKKPIFFLFVSLMTCSYTFADGEESSNEEVSVNDGPTYSEEDIKSIEEVRNPDSGEARPLFLF